MSGIRKILGGLGLALILIGGIMYGILYTSGIITFLPLLAGLVLSAASLVLSYREARTEGLRRSARFGIHTGVSILFLAAILIFLQTILARHGASIDTTANKRLSLAPQTKQILDGLTSEIIFTCFYKATTPEKLAVEDLLKEYTRYSPLIRYRFIDPDRDPVITRRYKIKPPVYGTVVVESGGLEEKITDSTEERITNAIVRATRREKKAVYFVTGHGERGLDDTEVSGFSALKTAIEEENYDVRELFLIRTEHIPADCDVLVFAGPESDILPHERDIVADYLSSGGKALFLLDPLMDIALLRELVGGYGITVGDDIVVDRFGRLLAGNYLTPVVNQYGDHPITRGFRHDASYYPQTRSVSIVENPPENVTAEMLGSTSPQAYAETNTGKLLEGASQYEGESDIAGPVIIAAVSTRRIRAAQDNAEGSTAGGTSRIAVFGDSDFASNGYISMPRNGDMILNTIGWLAEQEDLISIRPREALTQPVVLSERQGRIVFWLSIIGLPALVLVIGLTANILRRRAA